MDDEALRYDLWIEEALRQVIYRALELTAKEGLPGDHHFYITFKTGAEGVYAGILPTLGLGVALKIADGAKRAAEVAMAGVLQHLGVVDGPAEAAMKNFLTAPVLNAAGVRVGDIRLKDGWAG